MRSPWSSAQSTTCYDSEKTDEFEKIFQQKGEERILQLNAFIEKFSLANDEYLDAWCVQPLEKEASKTSDLDLMEAIIKLREVVGKKNQALLAYFKWLPSFNLRKERIQEEDEVQGQELHLP